MRRGSNINWVEALTEFTIYDLRFAIYEAIGKSGAARKLEIKMEA